jgi:hypothetical protein
MSTLREIQTGFASAILRGDATGLARVIEADGLAPEARVQVYRNHVLSSLTEALASTYPVVCRLVDRRFFGFAADAYIRRHPPAGPCLFEYGATFPDFLASFPACADHPYLGDVARLEWAMNATLHAEERSPIERAALGAVPADDIGRLVVRMDPAAAWLRSDWPVDRIWRANQPDADPEATVDVSAGPVRLEVRRRDDAVALRRLDASPFALRSTLAGGATLEAAVNLALAEDPAFDVTAALRALLDEALVVGLTLDQAEKGGESG